MQPRSCRAKPRGGDITSDRKDMLANQMPEEKWKQHIIIINNNGAVQGSHMCGLAIQFGYFRLLRWKVKLMERF